MLLSPGSEFSHCQYVDMYTREKLSAEIKLPEDTIKVGSSFSAIKMLSQSHTFNPPGPEVIVLSLEGLVFKQTG